jgi:hypothetical protein
MGEDVQFCTAVRVKTAPYLYKKVLQMSIRYIIYLLSYAQIKLVSIG